jgi:hypothetical protein
VLSERKEHLQFLWNDLNEQISERLFVIDGSLGKKKGYATIFL